MKIKEIFDEIAAESSTNKKVEILKKYADNTLLKRVLYLANSKRVKFYIKQIPEYTKFSERTWHINSICNLEGSLDIIEAISRREWTGNDAINELIGALTHIPDDDAYIIERIIEKDCKIGMGTSFINKVFPDLIEKTPYMGAISFDEKKAKEIFDKGMKTISTLDKDSVVYGMTYNAYSQLKMDGRYCNAIVRSGDVELESRQGEATILNGALFIDELSTLVDGVYNGELTMGPTISRYESNGIIASLIDIIGKTSERSETETNKKIAAFEKKHELKVNEALSMIVYTIWDYISIDEYFNAKSDKPYHKRLDCVVEQITLPYGNNGIPYTNIGFVETMQVNTYEEAMKHFQDALNRGEEGTILKATNGTWKNGKPNWQIKMKLEMDVDLVVTGFNYGTKGTKNENVISSLNAESSDGLIKTRPQGITEEMMKFITENQETLLGKVIEVKCSGLSKDSGDNHSLLHPAFIRFRDDKDTADSLIDAVNIEKMVKGLI